jgi:cobyric acid synthase CobQ
MKVANAGGVGRDHGGQWLSLLSKYNLPADTALHYDFSVNLNPLNLPGQLWPAPEEWTRIIREYPDVDAGACNAHLAAVHNMPVEQVFCGNGSTELMSALMRALKISKVAVLQPAWSGYAEAARAAGAEVQTLYAEDFREKDLKQNSASNLDGNAKINWLDLLAELSEKRQQQKEKILLIVAWPNNPDGKVFAVEKFLVAARKYSDVFCMVDLAFEDFITTISESPWWPSAQSEKASSIPENVIRVKSLTKFFGIAGLRLGFVAWANNLQAADFRRLLLPWQANGLAQFVGRRLYQNQKWLQESRKRTQDLVQKMAGILTKYGFAVQLSPAWILSAEMPALLQIKSKEKVQDVWNKQKMPTSLAEQWQYLLAQKGIMVRVFAVQKNRVTTQHCLRWGVLEEDALVFLDSVLADITAKAGEGAKIKSAPQRKVPALLVAGVTSDAGKSVIAAGIAAWLHKAGVQVRPFKAQNMSNQAWVSNAGEELGWAQAVQAFAAGVEPRALMNPVLLKPSGAGQSHVIYAGRDQGAMSVQEYHDRFAEHRAVVQNSLAELQKEADFIVLEGAGGVAEINLRQRDLSNREAPLLADADILLVGDIDRGGVFASLYGSWALLEPALQKRVCGFLINRMRGDFSLLNPGIKELEERTGVPVLGVLPWVEQLSLGEEDSMAVQVRHSLSVADERRLQIGIVRLPHIANINDWLPLQEFAGVDLFYGDCAEVLAQADALILPGTRNTISDLRWLKEQKLDLFLQEWHQAKRPLQAICGGMQILGQWVSDPDGVEGVAGLCEEGLGILPMQTTMHSSDNVQKSVCRRQGQLHTQLGAYAASGYEIHSGQSQCIASAWEKLLEGENCSWYSAERRLWASYWHGLFQQGASALLWLREVAQCAGKEHLLQQWPEPKDGENIDQVPHFLQKGIEQARELIECAPDLVWYLQAKVEK